MASTERPIRINRAPVLTLWAATVAETSLGIALIAGIRLRLVALASAALLAIFGIAMAISFGPKSPLDYSVFSASAGALLLALGNWPVPAVIPSESEG